MSRHSRSEWRRQNCTFAFALKVPFIGKTLHSRAINPASPHVLLVPQSLGHIFSLCSGSWKQRSLGKYRFLTGSSCRRHALNRKKTKKRNQERRQNGQKGDNVSVSRRSRSEWRLQSSVFAFALKVPFVEKDTSLAGHWHGSPTIFILFLFCCSKPKKKKHSR